MRHTRAKSYALAACLCLFLLNVAAAQSPAGQRSRAVPADAPEIAYTVSMPRPHTHLFNVEARLRYRGPSPIMLDLLMPVWTPGSYLIREFERHVQDFEASGADGRAFVWTKKNKNTWRVMIGGNAGEVRIRYSVYANELSVRTSELNDRHGFWNNANLLLYPDGLLGAPSTVKVEPFGDWKIATGLPAVPGASNTFRAEDFDVLYDSPFLVSNFKTLAFEVKGVPHRIVIDGEGNYDPERLRRDSQRVVEAQVEMMGDLPYRDYTVMLILAPTRGGGLEHLNSTALVYPRFGFATAEDWRSYHTLLAHEVFHVWNVKRIRPDVLGPFDYTQENYTHLLWVAEGTTNYYETLLVRRAGLMSDRQFLQLMAQEIQKLQQTPGRLKQSLEESSFDAWIEQYRPDENTVNTNISYYDKGGIVSMLLDLEIRRRSNGARSLDDVMRALNNDFFKQNRNYTPEDFRRLAERAAGGGLEEFFRRYVSGREELDYNAALTAVGLRLDTASDAAGRPAPASADLGAALEERDGRLTVRNVPAGTAAYEQGLSAADQIVAVDGYRATLNFLNNRIAEKRPGDQIALNIFRGDELRTLNFKLGARSAAVYRIVPDTSAGEQQKRNYQAWLGVPFPQTR